MSTSLESLSLNLMSFSYAAMDYLAESCKKCSTLTKIDLSCNDLDDSYGSLIANFVQTQAGERDQRKWKSVLRGSTPDRGIEN